MKRFSLLRPFAASLALAGLATFAGCDSSSETPTDGPKPTLGEKIKDKVEKGEEKAAEVGHKAVVATGKGVEATGKAIEKGGEKVETAVKDAAEKHLGDTAARAAEATGKAVEKAGAAVEKAGDKLQDKALPPPEAKSIGGRTSARRGRDRPTPEHPSEPTGPA